MEPIGLLLLAGTGALLGMKSPKARKHAGRALLRAHYRIADARSLRRHKTAQVKPAPYMRGDAEPTKVHGPSTYCSGCAKCQPQRHPAARPAPTPTVRLGHSTVRLAHLLDTMGAHMDAFRQLNRQFHTIGELDPTSLHELIDIMTGVASTLVAMSNAIGEIGEYADQEMWVDHTALRPWLAAGDGVAEEVGQVRVAIAKIRELYPAQLEAELEGSDESGPRKLNPNVVKTAA